MDSPVASADERKQKKYCTVFDIYKIIHPINPCFEFSSSHRVLVINAILTLFSPACINALVLNCPFSSHALLAR